MTVRSTERPFPPARSSMYSLFAFGVGEVTFPLGNGHVSSTTVPLDHSYLHLPSSLAEFLHIKVRAQEPEKALYLIHFYRPCELYRHLSLRVVCLKLS